MPLIILGILIGCYSFINFKKAFIWFMAYQIFVPFGLQLFSIGGTSLSIGLSLSFLFLILFFTKKIQKKSGKDSFPLKIAFIVIILARLLTYFTALGTFAEEFNRSLSFMLQSISNIYISWYVFNSKKEFRYFFKIVTITMFIACVFGYFEYSSSYNAYTNYLQDYLKEGISFYSTESVRGYRVTSFFEHPIGAGMNFGLYFVTSLYLYVNKGRQMPYRRLALLTAFLCVPLVILSKQRGAMIFTVFTLFMLLNFRKKRFYFILFTSAIAIMIISPMLQEYSVYFSSIFNQTAQNEVSGSSLAMRLVQLGGAFELWKRSPLFGIGEKFMNYVESYWIYEIYMLESVWLDQLVKHGIMGILGYVLLAKTTIYNIPKKYGFKNEVFLMISFWITYSITTIPAFRLFGLYIIIFYFILDKMDKKYQVS